jgi:hypothetical protein
LEACAPCLAAGALPETNSAYITRAAAAGLEGGVADVGRYGAPPPTHASLSDGLASTAGPAPDQRQ